MKIWLLSVASLAMGVGIGVAGAWSEFQGVEERLRVASGAPDAAAGEPRVLVVNGEEHNFDAMERDTTGRHAFIFKNVGQAPLKLEQGDTTCKCTLSELAKESVPPGETAEVMLEWTPKEYDPAFSQRAEIFTNDPTRPLVELFVSGHVMQSVRADINTLTMSNLATSTSTTERFHIYGYTEEPLEITETKLLNSENAEYFDVQLQPLEPEQYSDEPGATSGWRVEVTAKPGLPLGEFRQTIRFSTNIEPYPHIETSVQGNVVGDIRVLSLGRVSFSEERNLLDFGTFDRGEGAEANLLVLVKGPHRDEVKFSVRRAEPDGVLEVELGQPRTSDKVVTWPLKLRIPAGAEPVNRLGPTRGDMGTVVLESTHPEIEKITLVVRFSIAE